MSFTAEEFDPDTRSTIGVDLKVKIVHVRGKKIKLTIWDTGKYIIKMIFLSFLI